jgi:hypothetical protein
MHIVGIMSASFLFPARDCRPLVSGSAECPYTQSRESTWYTGVGWLKPGVTAAQVRAHLATAQANLARNIQRPMPTWPPAFHLWRS